MGVVGEIGPRSVFGIRHRRGRSPACDLAHETNAQYFAGKTSGRGRLMQLKPAPGRSYKERASTTESRPSTTGITTSTKRTMREEGTSKSGASQRGTGKLSGASSQARRTLPATGVGGSLNSGFLCLNETAPRWERLRARSSTHGVNNSRPSPAGARPGSTPPLNQGVSREIDPSDYAPKEFIVQSSDREISRFSQRFLTVSKMFTAVVSTPLFGRPELGLVSPELGRRSRSSECVQLRQGKDGDSADQTVRMRLPQTLETRRPSR